MFHFVYENVNFKTLEEEFKTLVILQNTNKENCVGSGILKVNLNFGMEIAIEYDIGI